MVKSGQSGVRERPAVGGRLRRLEGRHNPLIKELRRAFAQAELTPDGYCALEGAHILDEAIRSGLRFKAVFFSESGANRAHKLLPQLGNHVETLLLPDSLFAGAVPSETPQGVAALVQWKEPALADVLDKTMQGPLLVIAGVQDPGNLGTILRSAEAFGAGAVVLTEGTVSAINSKAIRASAGSIFRMPAARAKLSETVSALHAKKIRLLATSSHKGVALNQAHLSGPLAVFIGSEGSGLPREAMSQMDEILVIPHSATVESLNAGVAASIVLYEIARQRRNKSE
jgi:RNA methyltransferase, TrmH family